VTYAQLEERSDRLTGGLSGLGARKGDRVAILLHNSVEYVVADLAIARAGLIKVPLNGLLSRADVEYALEHSGASIVIVHDSLLNLLPEHGRVQAVVVPEELEARSGHTSFEELCLAEPAPGNPVGAAEVAIIMYTGGTTGRPKGIAHTAGALGTNLLTHVLASEIRFGEKMLLCTPLPHSAGFFLQAGLLQGATIFLRSTFEPAELLETVEENSISWTFMVPTMIYRLLDELAENTRDTRSLETIVYGAAPISKARIQEALDRLGLVFLQIFGQSECPNFATTLSKSDHVNEALLASCGKPVPGVEIRVAGEDGKAIPTGDVGEVLIRAPYTLLEYHRAPDLTEKAFFNSWLRTGDVGYQLDTEHLFLVDRIKDMVITGGMNVYCSEVENVLHTYPGVDAAAVVGIPDPDWGEAVHAYVVGRQSLDSQDLIDFCRERLAKYKVPKVVTQITRLATTPYGKIDKKALRRSWIDSNGGEAA